MKYALLALVAILTIGVIQPKQSHAFVGPTVAACTKFCPLVVVNAPRAYKAGVLMYRLKGYGATKIVKMYANGVNLKKVAHGVEKTIQIKIKNGQSVSRDLEYLNTLYRAIGILY